MKAFKQLNFRREMRLVWSYSAALALFGIFIMVRPVLAQEEKSVPEIKIDVKKEYDEQGRLIGVDSVRTWCWSGKHFSREEFDSVWNEFHANFDHMAEGNFRGPGFTDLPQMHDFWEWNGDDSTAYSALGRLDELFGEDFREYMKDFQDRFDAYQREHQQLIDKYFRQPLKEDGNPDVSPERYVPDPSEQRGRQSGKV